MSDAKLATSKESENVPVSPSVEEPPSMPEPQSQPSSMPTESAPKPNPPKAEKSAPTSTENSNRSSKTSKNSSNFEPLMNISGNPPERAHSAPPQTSFEDDIIERDDTPSLFINGQKFSKDDPRLSPSYYAYYYSQKPLDPRLPKPLFDWSYRYPNLREASNASTRRQPPSSRAQGLAAQYTNSKPPEGVNVKSQQQGRSRSRSFNDTDEPETTTQGTYSDQREGQEEESVTIGGRAPFPDELPVDNMTSFQEGFRGGGGGGHSGSYRGPLPPLPSKNAYMGQDPNQMYMDSMPMEGDQGMRRDMEKMNLGPRRQQKNMYDQGYGGYGGMYNSNPYMMPPGPSHHMPQMAVMGYGDKDPSRSPPRRSMDSSDYAKAMSSPYHSHHRIPGMAESQYIPTQHNLPPPGMMSVGQNYPNRNSMLNDFRGMNKSSQLAAFDDDGSSGFQNQLTLMDVVDQQLVAELSTDQNGSRFIQQRLERATNDEKRAVFEQIAGPETIRLCTDVFGNYVIQKFFEYGLPEHKQRLCEYLSERILPLALQMYGCRVIQKALEEANEASQIKIVTELDGHVMQCIKDQNGNHVIQKCIECVPTKHIDFIVKALTGRVVSLSSHPYGCRVIQRLLEHCSDEQKVPLLREVLSHIMELSRDQYGNYVVQHVLQNGQPAHKHAVIRQLKGNLTNMSKHKFASNVVEKAFVCGSDEMRRVLAEEVMGVGTACPLGALVRDQYGNYVVQKMLTVVSPNLRTAIVRRIVEAVPDIRKIAYGKHIVAKVEKLLGRSLQ